MLRSDLTEIIEKADYSDCYFSIRNLNVSSSELKVEFSINDTESDRQVNVLLTIAGNTDFYIIKDENSGNYRIEDDHPLLWKYSGQQNELYINGNTRASKELVFDLYNIHYSLFGEYVSFDPAIITIFKNGNGLFQKGSFRLLKMYADKINEYGIKTSLIDISTEENFNDLKILFLGNSYFIGSEFNLEVYN